MGYRGGISIRKSLLRNLLIMTAMLAGGLLLATGWGIQRATGVLSEALISRTTLQVESELKAFFAPVGRQLQTAAGWGENGVFLLEDTDALNRLFMPILEKFSQISSVVLASGSGDEYMLLRYGARWSVRELRPGLWPGEARVTDWAEGQEAVVERQAMDYNPHLRPWYQGAIDRLQQVDDREGSVYWTHPYLFFTAQEPGMTASTAFRDPAGETWVVAFDVLLSDISRFTMSQRISRGGKVVVLSDDAFRVIGLPAHQRFNDTERMQEVLLKAPGELGIPVLARAMEHYSREGFTGRRSRLLEVEGEKWWVGVESYALAPDRTLFTTVVVPEDDLYSSLRQMQLLVLSALALVLALALWRVVALSRGFSAPVEALVKDSHRISTGDLEDGAVINSTVEEFQRLARAHDEMRVGLRNKMRMEKHMRLARKIQEDTFPERLPHLPGYQLAGWSEPAEDAGGDTYDLVGMKYDRARDRNVLAEGDPDSVLMLLADATGHGVGPALSVTQVRAMIRIAARIGGDAPEIVEHINNQLCADLRDGRFITAWFGWLHGASHKLFSFSAGQGPLIHFNASTQEFTTISPDMPPLGILDGMPVTLGAPLEMGPGDLFVAISDGLVEPANPSGDMFGEQRVRELLQECQHMDADAILDTLRTTVEAFTGGAPAEDDRTVIVIKRERA